MNYYNWLFSGLVLVIHILSTGMTSRLIRELGISKRAAPERAIYISKIFNFAIAGMSIFALFFIWGVDYNGILLFGSSLIAITGVALFAQWSILSNLTASVVIFFNYPARIGDDIRIIDGENTIEGTIVDINMFQVLLEDAEGNMVNYPNNLLIQRPFVKIKKKNKPIARED
jgi:small-conductance mechanosensitive channel